jgi:hypothetical protein
LQGTKGRDKRRDIGQNSFFYGHIWSFAIWFFHFQPKNFCHWILK